MSGQNGDTRNREANGTRGASSVLDLAGLPGLSEGDANARLAREGPNELPAQKKRSLLAIGFGVVREPMFLMLVAAGIIYLLMASSFSASPTGRRQPSQKRRLGKSQPALSFGAVEAHRYDSTSISRRLVYFLTSTSYLRAC